MLVQEMEPMTGPQWSELVAGSEVGVSDWFAITQERIDLFAQATGDHQFIHVDPQRAVAEGPFGGTVAHGFLTLSLLPTLGAEVLRVPPGAIAVNYGLDKVRFISPVVAGRRVRGRFHFAGATGLSPARSALKFKATVEIEGEGRPALIVDPLILLLDETMSSDVANGLASHKFRPSLAG